MTRAWLYYLLEEDGRSLTIKDGVIQSVNQKTPLANTPDGWQDILIGYERNMSRLGQVRNFSAPLGFVLDGATILKDALYRGNFERKIYLLIQKLHLEITDGTYQWIYKYFYKGELDLTTLKPDGDKVTVSIMESGIQKQLKANEGTVYEYPLDDPRCINVKMDGILLSEKHNFVIPEQSYLLGGGGQGNHIPGAYFTTSEGQATGFASFSQSAQRGTFPDFATYQNFLFATTVPIAGMRIRGAFNFSAVSNVALQVRNSDNIVVATLYNDFTNIQKNGSFPFDITFNTEAGKNYFLTADGSAGNTVIYLESFFTIEFKSRFRTTIVKAWKPLDLFDAQGYKITGSEGKTASTLLGTNSDKVYTSGDGLRSLAGAKVKTSLTNFISDAKVRYASGDGIKNQKIIIEGYSYFLSTANPFHLGKAKDLKEPYPATDLLANTLKTGYQPKSTDDVNGKFAFNNTHTYNHPGITKITKELSFISPYTTDPYAIELYRINTEGKTTTDNSNDNEVFVLHVDLDNPEIIDGLTVYPLKRDSTLTITGVPDPETIFNVSQSPKRIAINHLPWVNSIFHGFEGTKLKFLTTEKNADLVTTDIIGGVIRERDDIEITGENKLFLPFYIECDIEVPADLVEEMEANEMRPFTVEWEGLMIEGFIIKAGIAPNTLKEQAYKLLLSPNNDLTKLI